MKNKIFVIFILIGTQSFSQNSQDSISQKNKILIEQLRNRITQIEDPKRAIDLLKQKEKKLQDSIIVLNNIIRKFNEARLTEKINSSNSKSDKELNDELKNSSLIISHLSDCNCNRLFFNVSQTKVDYNLFLELDSISNLINKNKDLRIKLVGHADKTGTEANNIYLSKERVENLKEYFINDKKVNSSRIITEWHGSAIPSKDAMDNDKQFLNRRVEIIILDK